MYLLSGSLRPAILVVGAVGGVAAQGPGGRLIDGVRIVVNVARPPSHSPSRLYTAEGTLTHRIRSADQDRLAPRRSRWPTTASIALDLTGRLWVES